jgi:ubiquinone/menaquinone biosynthesis C-methylase UbiE
VTADEYGMSTYGDAWAELYDQYAVRGWPDPASYVGFLAERANGGPVVELGIGTGRVGLLLAATGIPVIGIDASSKMLAQLRKKVADEPVSLVEGDFSLLDLPAKYPLIYCVGQSFLQLHEQEAQQECLNAVTKHLQPRGSFVVECHTPDLRRFRGGQELIANMVFPEKLIFTASTHDRARQQVHQATVVISNGEVGVYPHFWRYCSPSELELMADKAGMFLANIWEDPGSGTPFTAGPGPWTAEFKVKDDVYRV